MIPIKSVKLGGLPKTTKKPINILYSFNTRAIAIYTN